MTTTESKIETGTRPITRADEARAREAVTKAEASIRWIARREPMLSWTSAGALFAINGYRSEGTGTLWDEFTAALASAGIVPGPDGWCWAAAEPAPVPAETPAWLRDAVLAALPVDGTAVDVTALLAAIDPLSPLITPARVDAALAALVASGEIEAGEQPGGWRRWGVPEGWGWRPFSDVGVELLCRDGEPDTRGVIRAESNGVWLTYPRNGGRAFADDVATPPTLPAAKRAALRACWERGVFAPTAPTLGMSPAEEAERDRGPLHPDPQIAAEVQRDMDEGRAVDRAAGIHEGWHKGKRTPQPNAEPAPAETPATPPPTRAEQVRHALLAVLTRGPVEGFARLGLLLEAEGLADAPTMAEARQAAREIGAMVNGARWSLPEVPPGWGWETSSGVVHSYLRRGRQRVANVTEDGSWFVYPAHVDRSIVNGRVPGDPLAAQVAAIYAARRAGLFDVEAPPAESEKPERLPSPASVALSPECAEIDRLVQAHDAAGLGALAERWLREAMRARAILDALAGYAKRHENGYGPTAHHLRSVAHDVALLPMAEALDALARTLDTGPSEEHAEAVSAAPSESDKRLAALASAIAHQANAAGLTAALDLWGRALIAEARRGLTVPHEVVHRHLAERAYAEDALYLFDVYQAAMRVRDHVRAHEPSETDAIGALCALLDREPKPREPEPHPHRDGNEEPWETIERIARERDEARLEAEAAERRANAAQRDARGLADDRNKAIRRAEKAEAGLAALRQAIDDLGATWAKGRAT